MVLDLQPRHHEVLGADAKAAAMARLFTDAPVES
jgi:hypothetical protein